MKPRFVKGRGKASCMKCWYKKANRDCSTVRCAGGYYTMKPLPKRRSKYEKLLCDLLRYTDILKTVRKAYDAYQITAQTLNEVLAVQKRLEEGKL